MSEYWKDSMIVDLKKENAELKAENYKQQMREEKYSNQAQRAFDKADKLQEENTGLEANWEAIREFIGLMYLNGKISADSSGPIYAKMEELQNE